MQYIKAAQVVLTMCIAWINIRQIVGFINLKRRVIYMSLKKAEVSILYIILWLIIHIH